MRFVLTQKQKAEMKGHLAEWLASVYLRLKGYKILEKRYKTHVGEIDILLKKKDTLVAVEVKSRGSIEKAINSITPFQKKRIEKALLCYLSRKPSPLFLRFDVVLISQWKWPLHIKGAWNPD